MIRDEKQYEVVLKMILWGESRDAVLHRLKVNGITGERAEGIYEEARRERIATIRASGFRDFGLGLLACVLSLGATFGLGLHKLSLTEFGDGIGGILILPWLLAMLCVILLAVGLWKIVQGGVECLLASSKEGSVAND